MLGREGFGGKQPEKRDKQPEKKDISKKAPDGTSENRHDIVTRYHDQIKTHIANARLTLASLGEGMLDLDNRQICNQRINSTEIKAQKAYEKALSWHHVKFLYGHDGRATASVSLEDLVRQSQEIQNVLQRFSTANKWFETLLSQYTHLLSSKTNEAFLPKLQETCKAVEDALHPWMSADGNPETVTHNLDQALHKLEALKQETVKEIDDYLNLRFENTVHWQNGLIQAIMKKKLGPVRNQRDAPTESEIQVRILENKARMLENRVARMKDRGAEQQDQDRYLEMAKEAKGQALDERLKALAERQSANDLARVRKSAIQRTAEQQQKTLDDLGMANI